MTSSAQFIRACSPEWDDYLARVPHDFFQTAEYHAFSATECAEAWILIYGNPEKFVAWPYLLQAIDAGSDVGAQFRDIT